MSPIIDELLRQTLRTHIQVSRLGLQKIADQLGAASTNEDRARHTAAYNEQLKQIESMERELAALDRQEQQKPPDGPAAPSNIQSC